MTDVELRSDYADQAEADDGSDIPAHLAYHGASPDRRLRIVPILITLAIVALAVLLGWATWNAYMGAPWTRDGTVRANVVTMAPEVSGRIVELPVVDNQFVHKGDLLMVIDLTNYDIAVSPTRRCSKPRSLRRTCGERQSAGWS
jgi:multidrug resistance efflux pump